MFYLPQLFAENAIWLSLNVERRITVELSNTDPIVGLQFTVHGAQGAAIKGIEKGERLSNARWMLSYYQKNDSTLNVVLLNMVESELPIGKGTIAVLDVEVSSSLTPDISEFVLSCVVLSGIAGKSVDVIVANNEMPRQSTILGNYPNPFNPTTTIAYEIFNPTSVRLIIYDIAGREINRLVDEEQHQGSYLATWDGKDKNGLSVAPGTYFYQLVTNQTKISRKMLVQK